MRLLIGLIALLATPAVAQPAAPSSLVLYPLISIDDANGVDTAITLTNTGTEPVDVRCFYHDLTPRCGGEGRCVPEPADCDGLCRPVPVVIDFRFPLAAVQPTGWRASSGRPAIAVAGLGGGNGDPDVPALSSGIFRGTLRCFASDSAGDPIDADVLVGNASIETRNDDETNSAIYSAAGLTALTGNPGAESGVVLGGPDADYAGCPGAASLAIVFDNGVIESSIGETSSTTELALAQCAADLDSGNVTTGVAQLLVFNEFTQRFSTSTSVSGLFFGRTASIDGSTPQRSIFSAGVAGTIAGHAAMRLVSPSDVSMFQSGMLAIALETHSVGAGNRSTAAFAPAYGRPDPVGDVIMLPAPRCPGDCNGDGRVAINELITGVNMSIRGLPLSTCRPMDADDDGQIRITDLISAVRNLLDGCDPAPASAPPAATAARNRAAGLPTRNGAARNGPVAPTGDGPEISHLGLATAAGYEIEADESDDQGRPIFSRPHGQGFAIIVEALPGQNGVRPGSSAVPTGELVLPDLQLIVSRALGDGSEAVCDVDAPAGGVPATDPLQFGDAPSIADAIVDLTCRTVDRLGEPRSRGILPCTRSDTPGLTRFLSGGDRDTPTQFCLPIAQAWSFPVGDTVVAARVRASDGNTVGPVREMVVRVRGDR